MTATQDPAPAERSDLTELAALLNEIRTTWRPLDWPDRDRMRRLVLEGLYRFRGQQARPVPPPEDCPHDVSGLVDAPREQLLGLLKAARFSEAQLRDRCDRIQAGTAAQQRDLAAAVDRCAALVTRGRKTVPMDALRAALWPDMAP